MSDEFSVILEAAAFARELESLAAWADALTLCLNAPESERAKGPGWRALLAADAKVGRAYVNHPASAEPWLLEHWQQSGALRVLEETSPRFAAGVILAYRGDQARFVLMSTPLTTASFERDCGVVSAYTGSATDKPVRACEALVESWRQQALVVAGSELDRLVSQPQAGGTAPAARFRAAP